MAKILMIVGSLRKNGFHAQLSDYVEKLIGDRAEVEYLDYLDVPFFDQTVESDPPEAVLRVRKAVVEADGLWIFSPEYNHNIPGMIKNLLDWLSRPVGGNRKNPSVLRDKPFTFSCAAGKSCAGHVRNALKEFASVPGAKLVFDTGVGIKLGAEDFASDILPLTEETKAALEEQVRVFLDEIG